MVGESCILVIHHGQDQRKGMDRDLPRPNFSPKPTSGAQ